MPKYVAFLRAINVGGHTVRMEALRHLFEVLGFSNVETFIASGNVIFDSPSKDAKALEEKIEDFLQANLGYEVATFIRTIPEVAMIAEYKPFPDAELQAEGNTLYIGFLADKPGDETIEKLLSLQTAVDDFQISERQVYWLCRRQLGESKITGAQLARTLSMQMTLRNSTTVKKLAAKYS